MHGHYRALLIAAGLAILTGGALAQGLGIGIGLDDLRQTGANASIPPVCATNFVFDWSVSTGCNAITAVIR
jgi:hypothetical protein